jgi:hypothetical protein
MKERIGQLDQLLVTGWWFSPGTPVSSTNNTDSNDIHVVKILLKLALNILSQTSNIYRHMYV